MDLQLTTMHLPSQSADRSYSSKKETTSATHNSEKVIKKSKCSAPQEEGGADAIKE